ncbi:AAA family ATPase [Paenibacillus chitinolyticus]|uniref:AAA family ATPase n=1 Tax=Paenibacillus chitinolyticus TaxID=79263 RepID=UPI001C47AA6D|nr:AAA family ATPase [Paenibacillus chitinolyticus]MBV6714370.1 AAA family ATPase [Paenibacillus chitinolyticus]
MIIREIRVRGFGSLQNRTYRFESPVTVLYGPNEAGKSTLLGFIRAVLFGFPTRAQAADRYEPDGGGSHGGALLLEDKQGRTVLIERYADHGGPGRPPAAGSVKVTLEGGAEGGEELLRHLLGGLSAELFRSLFAFGLGELQELRTLQGDDIGGYLYGAGFGVSGSAVVEAERKLAARADALFRPRGRTQELNRSIRAYEELRSSRNRSADEISRYEEATAEWKRLGERLNELDAARTETAAELEWTRRCGKAFEPWLKLRRIQAEMAEIPEIPGFPLHAAERYEAIRQERDDFENERRQYEEESAALLRAVEALPVREELLEGAAELAVLEEEAGAYRSGQLAAASTETEKAQLNEALAALLRQLDEQWTRQDLADFPVSVGMKEQIREARDSFAKWDGERALLDSELSRVFGRLEEQQSELAERQLEWSEWLTLSGLREDAPGARTAAESGLLRRLSSDYAQWRLLKSEEEQRDRIREEERRRQEEFEAWSDQRRSDSDRTRKKTAYAAGAITVLLPAALLLSGQAGAAAAVFVVLAAGTAWLIFGSPDRARGNRHSRGPLKPEARTEGRGRARRGRAASSGDWLSAAAQSGEADHRADGEDAGLEADKAALRQRLQQNLALLLSSRGAGSREAAAARANGSADEASVPGRMPLPSWPETLSWLDRELESWLTGTDLWAQHRSELERRRAKLEELKQSIHSLEKQQAAVSSRMRSLEERAASGQERWSAWLRERKLRPHLSPEAALESLQLIARGHDLLQRLAGCESKLAALQASSAAFEARTVRLLGEAEAADPLPGLRRRAERLAEQQGLLARRERLAAEAAEARRRETAAAQKARQAAERLQALLSEGQAAGEEELLRQAALQERLAQLTAEARLLSGALDAHAGVARRERLDAALSGADEGSLASREEELAGSLSGLEAEANRLRDRRGRLAGELEKLEGGSERGELLQRTEEQLAEARELGGKYAVLAMAALLVKRTRERCERERQPGVLRRASACFAAMTGGRFTQVVAPFGQQRLYAVRSDGRQVDSSRLSRGTAEQLYLSMRFALVEEFTGGASLPLVFDDIFVNFDRERMEGALRIIGQFGGKRQVLLFTCHEHVRDAVTGISPAAGVLHV